MRSAIPLALLLAFGAATATLAQTAPEDAIGALLDQTIAAPDPNEPDTAAQPPAADPEPELRPVALTPGLPAAPIPYAPPPRVQLTKPVSVDETGKTPEGPLSLRAMAYDSRLRASFASAQSFQGPLDGGWTVAVEGEGDRYAFQLVDRAGRLDGAWRDLRRAGATEGSGLLDEALRLGSQVTLKFSPSQNAPIAVATLEPVGGQWRGELVQGPRRQAITLRRTAP